MTSLKASDRVAVYGVDGLKASRRTATVKHVEGDVLNVIYDNARSWDRWDIVHKMQCRKLRRAKKSKTKTSR